MASNAIATTMKEKNMQSVKTASRIGKIMAMILTYAFLIIMAIIVLFPFYWMINSSLKTLDEYRQSVPTFWPKVIMFSNYAEAFSAANLGRLFVNTMIVGIVSSKSERRSETSTRHPWRRRYGRPEPRKFSMSY